MSVLDYMRRVPTPEQLGLETKSLEEIVSDLAEFDRTALLTTLAHVALALNNAGESDRQTQIDVARVLLPSDSYKAADRFLFDPRSGIIFHRGQVRDLVRLLLSLPPGGTRQLEGDTERAVVTSCLQSIVEVTAPPFDPEVPTNLKWLNLYYLQNHRMQLTSCAIRDMFSATQNTLEILIRNEGLQERLRESLRFEPHLLLLPHFILRAYFTRFTSANLNVTQGALCEIELNMGKFGVTKIAYERFVSDSVMGDSDVLPYPESDDPIWRYRDYRGLSKRPFFRLPEGRVICLDADFASQRMALAVKAELDAEIGVEERQTKYGHAFEEYVRLLIARYSKIRRGVNISDRYPSDMQLDCGWSENGITVLTEVKSTIVNLSVKYSTDLEVMESYFDESFIGFNSTGQRVGTDGVAIPQLLDRVEAYIQSPSSFGLKRNRTIVAVLVGQDRSLSYAWLNTHLSKRFYSHSPDRRGYQVRFCVLDISELESLIGAGSGGAIADALLSFSNQLKENPISGDQFVYGDWIPRCEFKGEPVEESVTLLEQAYRAAVDAPPIPTAPQCSVCDSEWAVVPVNGRRRLYCLECNAMRIAEVTEDELAEFADARAAARARVLE